MNSSHRRLVAATALAALALPLAACSGSDDSTDTGSGSIEVWSLENLPDRVAVQKQIIAAFTAKTGIEVKLTPVDEAQVPQLIQSAALSGETPDVVGALSLAYVQQFDTQELLDPEANATVVKDLGADTWAPAVLDLTRDGDRQLAVPSDAWTQVLVYRKDLFAAAGLEEPTTYEALRAAADTLTSGSMSGITLATDPADVFTSQTFESLALGNDCQLVDADGAATLDSPACTTTFDLYGQLATADSPDGTQTVDSTRATYFAGQSAMVMWSTFLLDELAGLRNDAMPTCPECVADPAFLAKNSGVVAAIAGPDDPEPGSYGEATSWTVLDGADTDASTQFIEYMLSDGYLQWVGMAPEGKFPVRSGTADDPTKYVDEWLTLPAGVDTKKPLTEIYDAQTIETLTEVTQNIDRWAIADGNGAVLGPVSAELPLSKAVADMAAGSLTAAQAQAQSQDAVAAIIAKLDR